MQKAGFLVTGLICPVIFLSVYEGDEQTYTFSASTEEERDAWIQVLHVASYECLKMQLQSLREQVQAKTGQDPLVQVMPSDTGMDYETNSGMYDRVSINI